MKYLSAIQNQINKLDKKEVFLWGFYISFIIVMVASMVMDFSYENYIDVSLEIFFTILTILSMLRFVYSSNTKVALDDIIIIASLTALALLWSNHTTILPSYTLIPLGYFLSYSFDRALKYTLIYHMAASGILVYEYFADPPYPPLHDAASVVAALMASVMVVLIGIVYHIAVENSYQRLAQSDRQKEMLLREVHHRVKNNLNIISSMIGLQIIKEPQPRIQDILDKNRHRIRSIALVHEILYKHDDFAKIDIREYLIKLADTLLGMYDKEVRVTITGDQFELPIEQVMRIGIIANELITNSIKYALDTDNPYITIELTQNENSWAFSYSDSHTTPIDLTQAQSTQSLGMGFVEMMAEQLDAQMTIDSQAGLAYTIQIPKQTA